MRPTLITSWMAFLLLHLALKAYAGTRLGVFLPDSGDIKDIKSALKDDSALKNFKVNVYARFEDLNVASKEEGLDFIIAPFHYPKFYKGCIPTYMFAIKDQNTFQYQIVSLDKSWDASKLNQGVLAVINELGQKQTKEVLNQVIDYNKFKLVRQVSKTEDLYLLLALNNAQFGLFSPQNLKNVEKNFKSKPLPIMTSKSKELPVVCGKTGAAPDQLQALGELSKKTLNQLGFDSLVKITRGTE